MADYLLEIGLEELPSRFIQSLSQQLADRMTDYLTDNRLDYQAIEKFATPRRLGLRVTGLADRQADLSDQVRGPALKIAKDEDGNWTKAAEGFARGQGVSADDLVIQEVKGEDYVFVNRHIEGQPASQVLSGVHTIITDMTFPISMRWHNYSLEYMRPFHWFVSLLDDQVLPFELLDIEAGRQTRGHRFLAGDLEIDSAQSYEDQLREAKVIASFADRQETIREAIQAIARDKKWTIEIDEDLLEEATGLVEWPTAFYGEFEADYLKLPEIILVTAMRDHQRYFPVYNEVGDQLLPYFISVRNGNDYEIDNVIKGNLKVLKARLEDALFFYEDDLAKDLDHYVGKLADVNEHFKLGSLTDKQDRVAALLVALAERLTSLDADELATAQRASQIYKFDLTTGTVDEFAELQGEVGAIYARDFGETELVAEAIRTQYLPKQAGGGLPTTGAGALLALADKLDTLYHYFKVGLIPSGSADPYALRRAATGLVEIILDQGWQLDLADLLQDQPDLFPVTEDNENVQEDVLDFIKQRMIYHLQAEDIDHDIIQAAVEADNFDLVRQQEVAQGLRTLKDQQADRYVDLAENLARIVNLGVKVEGDAEIDPELAETDSEAALFQFVESSPVGTSVEDLLDYYSQGTDTIVAYFDNNMVNADDEALRANRLATMKQMSDQILSLMDPRLLISKF